MPSNVPSPAPADPAARASRRTRAVLVGACTTGLVGLALTGAPAAAPPRAVALQQVSSSVVSEPTVIRGLFTARDTAPVVASRSRPLTARKAPRRAVKPVARKPRVLAVRWVRPSWAGITSPYGMRWGRMHKGIDFGAPYGARIFAIGDGVVVGAGYQASESGYGQITIIRHADGFYSAYAHQSRMLVQAGDQVHAGELIGYVGSTGEVTGPHLHFEIRTEPHGGQVNPLTWLREHGVGV